MSDYGKYDKSIKDLQAHIIEKEKKSPEGQERALDALLELGHYTKQEPKYSDPLTAEMVKNAGG